MSARLRFNHHRVFSFIQRTDHPFLYGNGLLLLFITFMPFPTALLAEYLLHPETTLAGAVFAGTYVASAFAFKGLWHHASKKGRLLAPGVDQREIRQINLQYRYAPILYLGAFVSVGLSVGMCPCLAVFFAFKGWPMMRKWKEEVHAMVPTHYGNCEGEAKGGFSWVLRTE